MRVSEKVLQPKQSYPPQTFDCSQTFFFMTPLYLFPDDYFAGDIRGYVCVCVCVGLALFMGDRAVLGRALNAW